MKNKPRNLLVTGLEGSPYSGKTTTFNFLKKALGDTYGDVCIMYDTEAATVLFSKEPNRSTGISFQMDVIRLQMEAIDDAIAIAEANPDKLYVLITDRTLYGTFVYTPEFYRNFFNKSFAEELYDELFFFQNPDVADDIKAGNELRRENSFQEIATLSKLTYTAVKDHGHLHKVGVFERIEDKGLYVAYSIQKTIDEYKNKNNF